MSPDALFDDSEATLHATDLAIKNGSDGAQDANYSTPASPPGTSHFEQVVTTCPPVLETLLLHLPTSSIFDLYHTSPTLRRFLKSYPLAWKNLSFRLLPAPPSSNNVSGFDSPTETSASKRPHALDFLLRFALPSHVTLTRLDLDNTSVSGTELHTNILNPYRAILQHLSVRGCKDVSIKYHILPFLTSNLTVPADLVKTPLALKSLYVYRCRHHRRRPYLPSSLNRRDSDSHPTHTLIEICHRFGIWTDTAWCPTPGGRCFRRKDYWIGRSGFGASEVWVPFDRLWRSQNFVGSTDAVPETRGRQLYNPRDGDDGSVGRLWDDHECGYGGEALGTGNASSTDGKELPMHLRKSHNAFVEGFKCDACGDAILERCEQCSVRMHCVACRKTLCHSCAFDKPMRKKRRRNIEAAADMTTSTSSLDQQSAALDTGTSTRRRRQHRRQDRFWWAPGATRSPNMMNENSASDDSSSEEDNTPQPDRNDSHPRLDMHWCCLKPSFSGGGGIGFIGTPSGDNVRAAPLPQGHGYEDAAFAPIRQPKESGSTLSSHRGLSAYSTTLIPSAADAALFDSLSQLAPPNHNITRPHASPRSLCSECYSAPTWRISCKACNTPICIDHDIRQLKVRRCGFRKLDQERNVVQTIRLKERDEMAVPREARDAGLHTFLAKWRPVVAAMEAVDAIRRKENKWAPEERDLDSVEDELEELTTPTAMDGEEEITVPVATLRRTKSVPTLPSQPASTPDDDASLHSPSSPRSHYPRWTGCGAYLCPYPRALGDPRPRCTATEANFSSSSHNHNNNNNNNHVQHHAPPHATTAAATVPTQNTNIHLANPPTAIPLTANLGPFGTLTLTPGANTSFVYHANGQPLTLLQHHPPTQGGNFFAVPPHAAAQGNVQNNHQQQQQTRVNENEALRCAHCSILVCADCRREHPVCPCSACSPTPGASYAQAASGAGSGLTTNNANGTTAAGSAAPATTPPTDATVGINHSANQLCPSCRLHPQITSRCRFALETARALEVLPAVAETLANARVGALGLDGAADTPSMLEDGAFMDFWVGVEAG